MLYLKTGEEKTQNSYDFGFPNSKKKKKRWILYVILKNESRKKT